MKEASANLKAQRKDQLGHRATKSSENRSNKGWPEKEEIRPEVEI